MWWHFTRKDRVHGVQGTAMIESLGRGRSNLEILAATLTELRQIAIDCDFPMIKYLLEVTHLEVTATISDREEKDSAPPRP